MAAKKGRKKTNTNAAAKSNGNRQIKAVVLFAVSLFLMALVFIKGENFWTVMRNFVFGVFGITAFFYPFFVCVIAFLTAMGKAKKSFKIKLFETEGLVLLLGAVVDILRSFPKNSFVNHLTNAYETGTVLKSGGFIGALLGHPLYMAFGKVGAAITVFLLMFVLIMLITGATLISLFESVKKPAQNIKEEAKEAYAERVQKRAETREKQEQEKVKKVKTDIDFAVDDTEKEYIQEDKKDKDKGKTLINAYNDEEDIEDDDDKLEDALNDIDEENNERITVDMEEETAKVTEEIAEREDTIGYIKPPVDLLSSGDGYNSKVAEAEHRATAERLVETLRSFGIETKVVDVSYGPTVTRYELQPKAGVKISKITSLADDIAMNLATAGVRIEAPIPNKAAVGIEVPNRKAAAVHVREIIESTEFTSSRSKLTVAMGRDIAGKVVVGDISKMPHGLIAGATGSGKSVCINSIIMSILYKANPDEVKLLMVDPKVVELGIYNGIPHLLIPVVTDPRKAAGALGWAVEEMENRYRMFADRNVRDIEGYNRFVDTLTDEPDIKRMPHIVIIIDELADLMMTAPREVEESIRRIAAKARAAGMHLLIATQRPSVDVITGVIKANIPTRIAFAVSSGTDSRTILDTVGAEKLLGRGDMLFAPIGSVKPKRVQGCFVSDGEVEKVVKYVKSAAKAHYDDNIMQEIERQAAMDKQKKGAEAETDDGDTDPVLEDAIKIVVEMGQASTSLLQRKLKLGYARAARVIDMMEQRGIVGPYEGSKPRKVLITMDELNERIAGDNLL